MGRLSEINPWDDDPSITKGAFIDSASKRITQQVSGREKIKNENEKRLFYWRIFICASRSIHTHT